VNYRKLGLAAAGVGAAIAAERLLVGRPRRRLDPAAVEAFRFPDGALHHDVATSDGGTMHVVEHGDPAGRPIVLLHGITLSALTWHYQLLDLTDRYRLLAVDLRGHGSSVAGADEWHLDRLATDLAELFDHLDLRDAVLVGHSMGGMVALRFALDHRATFADRVAGLVLMSTSAGPVVRLAAYQALTDAITPPARYALSLGDRIPGGLFGANDLSYLIFRLGMGRDPAPEHVELNRLMTAGTPVTVWSELIAHVAGFDVRDRLGEIDVPALVLVGTRDLLTPPASARQLVAGLPQAKPLVAYPGAGHMLMLERRAEVAEELARFVAGLP
jgi:pimeloyl-ACP methyl ester carboxylesterase